MIGLICGVLLLCGLLPSLAWSKAFPTAEGYGANAQGGRGGSVCYVTSLADSGPNTYRDCLTRSGPRNVLFTVSGTIVLESAVRVTSGFLTIAGQTSPGGVHVRWVSPNIDGRLTAGGTGGETGTLFLAGADHVIIRHMHFRGGGYYQGDGNSNVQFYSSDNARPNTPHDFILDHISDEWTADASPQYYGSYWDNATLQWSLIAEGANLCDAPNLGQTCPGSSKGSHIGGPGTSLSHVTLHHNAWISNGIRNPLVQGAVTFDMRNNFIYNAYGGNFFQGGEFVNNASVYGNMVNNVFVQGPSSSVPVLWLNNILGGTTCGTFGSTRVDGSSPGPLGSSQVYSSGNWGRSLNGTTGCVSGCADDWELWGTQDWWASGLNTSCFPNPNPTTQRLSSPMSTPTINQHPTSQVESVVLADVGANRIGTGKVRDTIDTRIITYAQNRTACAFHVPPGCISATGGNTAADWNIYTSFAAPLDTDGDGMPDSWEDAHGLNKNNPADGAAPTASGYTNLEIYLNFLAGDGAPPDVTPVAFQVEFGVQPTDAQAGQTINPAPQVRIEDTAGNLITTGTASTASVALSLVSTVIPRASLALVAVDAAQTGWPGSNAIDGDPDTAWHTPWTPTQPGHPHTLVVTFPSGSVNGLIYTPRLGPDTSGQIIGYNVYVSTDGSAWGAAVATGSFGTQSGGKTYGITWTPKTGSYLKLESTSSIEGFPYASVAELSVLLANGTTLSGALTQAAVAGVATFPGLTIGTSGTGYVLKANSGTLQPQLSLPATITVGIVPQPQLLRFVPGR